MCRVLVLHAVLPRDEAPAMLEALLGRLPYARRLELERRAGRDRVASLAGLWLALAGAARIEGKSVDPARLRFQQGCKPRLEHGPPFSISHGERRVGVALGEGHEVGFDLEERGSAAPGKELDGAGTDLERWTATEAVLKCAGRGLREARAVDLDADLRAARFGGTVYRLAPVALAPGVVSHVATPGDVAVIEVEEFALPND